MNGSVSMNGSTLLSGGLTVNTDGVVEPIDINISENGDRTITAPAGIDGYSPITIHTNVPQQTDPILDDITITENGNYTPPAGTDGYNDITVNVPQSTPVLDEITITENGTYTPPEGTDGYDNITVNVPQQSAPVLDDITITENGTYTPPTGTDGYDEITVNVPGLPYYEYENAFNGQIVVRKEASIVNNKLQVKTLWFFNGWTKEAGDVSIPSNLIPYIPKTGSTVIMTSSYSDNTSTTQNGWVGFLYPSDPSSRALRTWSEDKGSTIAGTFWGVLDIDGADEQTRAWFDPYDV